MNWTTSLFSGVCFESVRHRRCRFLVDVGWTKALLSVLASSFFLAVSSSSVAALTVFDDGGSHTIELDDFEEHVEVWNGPGGTTTTVTVTGGHIDGLTAYENSEVIVLGGLLSGLEDRSLWLTDDSTAYVSGGRGRLSVTGNAVVDISGGVWNLLPGMEAGGASETMIRGGEFDEFLFYQSAHVTVLGSAFNLGYGDFQPADTVAIW